MSENKYPNSGRLSKNKYKDNPKKPDIVGELVMTRSALKGLLEEHDGDDIVIKLSAWKMEGQYGTWIRLSWNNYKPRQDGGYPSQRYQKDGNVANLPKQRPIDDDQDIPF